MDKINQETDQSKDEKASWDDQRGPDGLNGCNGFGYQYYYYVTTDEAVPLPRIIYDGFDFTTEDGWSTTIPKEPIGANVFLVPVRYQMGINGQILEGMVLFGKVPEILVPPKPRRVQYSNGIDYGIADGNDPAGTVRNSAPFSLLINQSHTTSNLNFPRTTDVATNYYIQLPDGLTLTQAVDSIQGDETDSWIRVGSSQIWVFTIGFANTENAFSFSVRRES